MKTYIILLLTLALQSCSILKKNKQSFKKLTYKEQLQLLEQRNIKSQQSQMVLIDSNHNDFTMLLWPKGKFTFSVANGFEGEAEKILIREKRSGQKMVTIKHEINQDSTRFQSNYTKEKENSSVVKKNKVSVGYNWFWLILIPALYLCYWLYKRR